MLDRVLEELRELNVSGLTSLSIMESVDAQLVCGILVEISNYLWSQKLFVCVPQW